MQQGSQNSSRQHPLHGISLNRTVIIGLGSTGLKVLESFQELWFERFSNTTNSLVRLINIETDSNNKPQSIEGNSMIEQITINNNNLDFDELANYLRKNANPLEKDVPEIEWDWNWTKEVNWKGNIGVAGAAGAGGIRAGGRMILYAPRDNQCQAKIIFDSLRKIITDPTKWQFIDSPDEKIRKRIIEDLGYPSSAWVEPDKVINDPITGPYSVVNPYINKEIKVIVVGSLTGGTCSGTFIDMGFIIKRALNLNDNELYKYLTGIFLIPPNSTDYLGGGIDIYRTSANTFGAIYEIRKVMNDYFNRKGSAPYGVVYLVAPEYNSGNPSHYFDGIDGFAEAIALRLFATCLGYGLKIDSSNVNIFTNNPRDYLFTFGIGAVLYPKFILTKALSTKLAVEIIERLLDEENIIQENGKTVKINDKLNTIKNEMYEFVNKKIKDNINKTITNKLREVKKKNKEYYIDKWKNGEKIENDFINDYTKKEGFYYGIWGNSSEKIEKDFFDEFKKDVIKKYLESYCNIGITIKYIDCFVESMDEIKKLYEKQGAKDFESSLKRNFNDIFDKGFKIDKNEILESKLWLLYEYFVLSKSLGIIESLIEKVKYLKKNLENVRYKLSNNYEKYLKEYNAYWNKLDTHIEKTPIIKLFKQSKENDFDEIKKKILGDKKSAGFNLFEDDKKEAFLDGIINNNLENIFSDIISSLRNKSHEKLIEYLRKEDDKEKSFSIIDKMLEDTNVSSINTTFNMIRSGFLKHNLFTLTLPKDKKDQNKEYVHHLISNSTNEEMNKIKEKYYLKDSDTECRPYSNKLFEDMVVYVKDVPGLKFYSITKFEDLKTKFLEKPSVGFAHLDSKEWQRLRLTLAGDLDFSIIEEQKKETLDNIRKFIRFFWLKPISHNKYERIDKPFYKVPTYYEGDNFLGEGLYYSNDLWYLKYKVKGSGQEISLCINSEIKTQLNKILSSSQVFDSLIEFFSNNTEFYGNNPSYYISLLYKHWDTCIRPIFQNEEKYQIDYYEATFVDGYDGSSDFKINIFEYNRHKSLIGYLLSLKVK